MAFNPLSSNQLKIGEALSESSRILGKGRLATFLKIDLPLLRPAVIGAFILVFIDIMKELPITLILKPYDVQTLAVKAYEYASDELILEASLPALCIVVTGILPVVLLNRFILDEKKLKVEKVVLNIQNLNQSYEKQQRVIKALSLLIYEGSIVSLVGKVAVVKQHCSTHSRT